MPTGWVWTRFGDTLDIQGGSQPDKKFFLYEPSKGYVRLLQIRDFGGKPVPTYVPRDRVSKFCERSDVLVARYGASLGRILTGMEGAYNVALAKVIHDRNLWLPQYLFYLLQTPHFQTPIHMISRSAQNGFNKGEVFPIWLPLPPPPEQHRIVAKIEELLTRLDAGAKALNAVKAQLRRYRQSVLKSAFEGTLTTKWRKAHKGELQPASVLLERIKEERQRKLGSKYKESTPVDASELPELPEGWEWVRMDEICIKIQDGTHFSPKVQHPGPSPKLYKYITAKNIREKGLDLSDLTYIDEPFHKSIYSRCNPEKGDVLLTKDGVNTGVATTNTLDEEFSILSSVALLKPEKPALRGQYLRYFLNSPVGFRLVTGKMTGTAIKRIIMEKIRPCEFPLAPIEEQDQVVSEIERVLSVTHAMEEVVEQSLGQSERLRQSILKRAFEGKLVPQDPSDEPAEKLLERIKAERERMAEKGAKGRGIGKARRAAKLGN